MPTSYGRVCATMLTTASTKKNLTNNPREIFFIPSRTAYFGCLQCHSNLTIKNNILVCFSCKTLKTITSLNIIVILKKVLSCNTMCLFCTTVPKIGEDRLHLGTKNSVNCFFMGSVCTIFAQKMSRSVCREPFLRFEESRGTIGHSAS